MDLQQSVEQECTKCLSHTMKFDIKSGLFKCFNSRCGFIQSLTVITYEDENIFGENETSTITEQMNNRRYIYGNDQELSFTSRFQSSYGLVQHEFLKNSELGGKQILDVDDRIRNEINSCKKLIKRWCDFLDDKKILFEIVEHFLELVNLDNQCTVPSVKRKAASSFCFVMMKQQGLIKPKRIYKILTFKKSIGSSSDLEAICQMTGVSLAEVIKEQEKVKAVKFPIRTNEQSLNLISQQDSTPKQSQWEQICFGYISKILCNNLNQKQKNETKKACKTYVKAIKVQDVKPEDYMSKEDIAVFFYFEKNIKLLNPKKLKYEKNKVCASIIFTFCRLTNIPELKIASPDELSTIIQLQEKSILKYYRKIIFPNREEVIPKQDIWPNRYSLSVLQMY